MYKQLAYLWLSYALVAFPFELGGLPLYEGEAERADGAQTDQDQQLILQHQVVAVEEGSGCRNWLENTEHITCQAVVYY